MVGRTAIQIPPVLASYTDFLTFRWTAWLTISYQILDIHVPLSNSCILTVFLKVGPYLLQKDRGKFERQRQIHSARMLAISVKGIWEFYPLVVL